MKRFFILAIGVTSLLACSSPDARSDLFKRCAENPSAGGICIPLKVEKVETASISQQMLVIKLNRRMTDWEAIDIVKGTTERVFEQITAVRIKRDGTVIEIPLGQVSYVASSDEGGRFFNKPDRIWVRLSQENITPLIGATDISVQVDILDWNGDVHTDVLQTTLSP